MKIRRTWEMNPKTRIKKSKKVYSRKKTKEETKEIILDNL